eukprot:TRINITY_DN2490_c0_g1_i2.p1 TRINITY_DN2490_c0_g1~~TRINITY_DN2490_c0_g1_i2.p1  ORF type:complete len:192 (+),score=3.33 TRINITY_DN2490_c0_g1_i2:170-745(+)
MSNIHGIRDLRENEPERPAGNEGSQSREAELFMADGEDLDPRKLSHCQTLQRILCPYFKCSSFLFIISIIQILLYVGTITYSAVKNRKLSPDANSFLGPCTSTLVTFGAKVILSFTLVRSKHATEFEFCVLSLVHADVFARGLYAHYIQPAVAVDNRGVYRENFWVLEDAWDIYYFGSWRHSAGLSDQRQD